MSLSQQQLEQIIYANRFQPHDSVMTLIEDIIQHFHSTNPNFNELEFRKAADYPYNSNGDLIHFNDEGGIR